MSTKTLTTAVLAASITGFASAGVLTMTVDSAVGTGTYESLTGYKLVLTIDCSTMTSNGSSSSFTLNAWDFQAFDAGGDKKFWAVGSGNFFTVAPGSTKLMATIALSSDNIQAGYDLVPAVESISFLYAFTVTDSLEAAIYASAGTSDGILQLGSDTAPTGILDGSYSVPAPGAAALLGLGGLISRRRKA